jgi:hypothetical protein
MLPAPTPVSTRYFTHTALCSFDRRSLSTSVLTLSLAHRCATRSLACRQKFECPPATDLISSSWMLSYMPLVSYSNVRLCCSYSSGNVWYTRKFSLFLAWDGSRAMTSRVLRDAVLPWATAICYNILPCPELNSDFPLQVHDQIIRAMYTSPTVK